MGDRRAKPRSHALHGRRVDCRRDPPAPGGHPGGPAGAAGGHGSTWSAADGAGVLVVRQQGYSIESFVCLFFASYAPKLRFEHHPRRPTQPTTLQNRLEALMHDQERCFRSLRPQVKEQIKGLQELLDGKPPDEVLPD